MSKTVNEVMHLSLYIITTTKPYNWFNIPDHASPAAARKLNLRSSQHFKTKAHKNFNFSPHLCSDSPPKQFKYGREYIQHNSPTQFKSKTRRFQINTILGPRPCRNSFNTKLPTSRKSVSTFQDIHFNINGRHIAAKSSKRFNNKTTDSHHPSPNYRTIFSLQTIPLTPVIPTAEARHIRPSPLHKLCIAATQIFNSQQHIFQHPRRRNRHNIPERLFNSVPRQISIPAGMSQSMLSSESSPLFTHSAAAKQPISSARSSVLRKQRGIVQTPLPVPTCKKQTKNFRALAPLG